jgi:hypothetical protein
MCVIGIAHQNLKNAQPPRIAPASQNRNGLLRITDVIRESAALAYFS